MKERLALLTEVLAGAASADPDASALHERMQKELYENQRTVLESIDAKEYEQWLADVTVDQLLR